IEYPCYCFSINHTAPTDIYTLSLHDALPICCTEVEMAKPRRILWPDERVLNRRWATSPNPENSRICGTISRIWAGAMPMAVARKIGRAHAELQSRENLVCRLLLEKKKKQPNY